MTAAPLPAWFDRAYRSMPDRLRAVYRLSAGQGLGHVAIGERLGLTIAEVERALADALVHLEAASREGEEGG